ncbi:MAG: glycerophosphodiester phosphodiesterase [Caldilineaceae bacterium]|nr:glycerophosphodiester phosphodiesterase [Caldilineaceae bacterium]
MRHPQIFAHRGAKLATPENTLPAFAKALEMGADGIELDVHLSKDGQLVVIHDFTVDKTTNGHGSVRDFTAAELARLDAGSHFDPSFAGVGVPTLDQVLDLVGDRCRINVEVKNQEHHGGYEVEALVKLIQQRTLYDQVIVSSFNPMTLIKMRWADPKVRLGLLYFEPLPPHLKQAWFSPIIQPEALHPYFALVDATLMAWAHERRCAVNTWTVNDVAEAKRLAALGVDVIMTDAPDLIRQALASS